MSRFMSVYKPVREGWGVTLARVGAWMGVFALLGGAAAGPVGLAIGGIYTLGAVAVNSHIQKVSEAQVKKVLSEPRIKKYIKTECDRIYKDLSKHYSSRGGRRFKFSKKVSDYTLQMYISEDITKINKDPEYRNSDTQRAHEIKNENEHYIILEHIGEYTIGLFADTDHVQGIDVFFELQNLDRDDEPKLVHHNITAPSRQDLKDMGFREE